MNTQIENELFWNIPSKEDCPYLTEQIIRDAEAILNYRLPKSYIDTLRKRNGGHLRRNFYHKIFLNESIFSIDDEANNQSIFWLPNLMGLGGENGIDSIRGDSSLNEYLIRHRGYPNTGIVICHAGDAGFLLDYSKCVYNDEPSVVYVFTGNPENIVTIPVADSFRMLISGLYRRPKDPDLSPFEIIT